MDHRVRSAAEAKVVEILDNLVLGRYGELSWIHERRQLVEDTEEAIKLLKDEQNRRNNGKTT